MTIKRVNKTKFLKYLERQLSNITFWMNKGHPEFTAEKKFYSLMIEVIKNGEYKEMDEFKEVEFYEN